MDRGHRAREWVVLRLAYFSFLLYGFEDVELEHLQSGRYRTREHSNLALESTSSLDDLAALAKAGLDGAQTRRSVITDKCKTLLTMSSLLLGLIGILLPKSLVFAEPWMRVICFVAMLALLNTVLLLLMFFGVSEEEDVVINQSDVELSAEDLKKSLINRNRRCQTSTDNRTDYLVDLYKVARFYFLSALAVVAVLFSISFLSTSPRDQAENLARELRSDPKLIRLLQGPQGLPGAKGEKGQRGEAALPLNADDVVNRLLNDPRFRKQVAESLRRPGTPGTGSTKAGR